MRRHASSFVPWVVALGLLPVLVPVSARAETYFGFQLGITKAPAAPEFVFENEPRVVVVPATRVSRVADLEMDVDLFRFGGTWYAYSAKHWYRSADVSGPYRVVDVRYVPRAVLFVPPMHWKNHPHGWKENGKKPVAAAASAKAKKGRDSVGRGR